MQIILGVIFIVLLIVILAQSQLLSTRSKTVAFSVMMMVLAAAILYEFSFSKTEEHNRTLINAFNQNKTLLCKETPVTQENYNLERGTLSFMAKPTKKELIGTIYSIEDCKIKE